MRTLPGFRYKLLLVILLIFFSRVPFLNNGYGAEEDSWGLALNSKVMAQTHSYEASRFPGHPLQEFIYALISNKGALVFNLLTALISTAGILFFILALKKFNSSNPILSGAVLAFVPVVYINSTNNMDYTWAMAFILASFYFLVSRKYLLSGSILALAIGCRITSGIMIPVFLFYVWKDSGNKINHALKFLLSTLMLASLLFLPVYLKYGSEFFTATDYFPYPPFSKVLYKGSIGVLGTLGTIAVCTLPFLFFKNRKMFAANDSENRKTKLALVVSALGISFYAIAYLLKPEKSAYLIPAIPFVILIASLLFERKKFIAFGTLLIASSFVAGVNLEDNLRGSNSSSLSLSKTISGQQISFDLLQGTVMADFYKRKNKMIFTSEIVNKISTLKEKTVIIAGWWFNEISMTLPEERNPQVELIFYADENELQKYSENQYSIFYLPEQNKWNDLRYQKQFTEKYAKAW